MGDEEDTLVDRWLKKFPRVTSCCLLLDQKLGSKLIAYSGVVFGAIFFIFDILDLALVADMALIDPKVMKSKTGIIIFDVIVQVAFIAISVYLLIGLKKRRRGPIKVYILVSYVLILAKIISALVLVIYRAITMFLICLFYAGFQVYYTLVVTTHCVNMDTGGRHY